MVREVKKRKRTRAARALSGSGAPTCASPAAGRAPRMEGRREGGQEGTRLAEPPPPPRRSCVCSARRGAERGGRDVPARRAGPPAPPPRPTTAGGRARRPLRSAPGPRGCAGGERLRPGREGGGRVPLGAGGGSRQAPGVRQAPCSHVFGIEVALKPRGSRSRLHRVPWNTPVCFLALAL